MVESYLESTLGYIHLKKDKGVYYVKYPSDQIFPFTTDLDVWVFYIKSLLASSLDIRLYTVKASACSLENYLTLLKASEAMHPYQDKHGGLGSAKTEDGGL